MPAEPGNTRLLLKELIATIDEKGPISFADFMEIALYDPAYGYYTGGARRVGFEGDFFTSPSMSPAFGMTLARLVPLVDEALNHPDKFSIVELGAGDGKTARQIIETLKKYRPDIYPRIKYICVERGINIRDAREEVEWVKDISSVTPIRGIVLSNEFFDAIPVRRVVMRDDGLHEIMVGNIDGALGDVERKISDIQIEKYFRDLNIELEKDREAEVCLEAKSWIDKIAAVLEAGVVATIDYGYPAFELYAPHRKRGTLTAYHKHKQVEEFYLNVGEQDLTAHVNFTALSIWGKSAGLDTIAFTDQLRFFLDLGIHEVFAQIESESASYADFQTAVQPAKALIMPGGMGETFKALLQQKGIEEGVVNNIFGKIKSKYPLVAPPAR